MKRVALLVYIIGCSALAQAQLRATYPSLQLSGSDVAAGIDAVFLFNGISLSSEIAYTGAESNVEWKTFDGGFVSSQKNFSPDDGEGYILNVDGRDSLWIWVIDYARYPVSIASVEIVEADDRCDNIKLVPAFDAADLIYKDKHLATHTLPRTFTIRYNETTFSGESWTEPVPKEMKQQTPFAEIVLDAPFCDTQYTLTGDNWAEQLGAETVSASSSLYRAIAVEAHPKGVVEERAAKNELERSGADISGSGPLVVSFESRVNPLSANYYEWFIFPVDNPSNYVRYSDQDLRYTFADSGTYRVRLVASSGSCEHIDSLEVKVLESFLDVPNVFTPNGDGVNDEFRVSFKSLATYSCHIFNRWGRQVFSSTDPGKGWDGTINGKLAAPGAYYYVIHATGTDLDSKGKPIVYKRSGDINLLRGKAK